MLLTKDTPTILPISHKLVSLTPHKLTQPDKAKLLLIINQLFLDIELGHSCSLLCDLAKLVNLDQSEVLKLLNSSTLAMYYTLPPQLLATLPISIVKFKDGVVVYITKYLQYELNIVKQLNLLNYSYEEQLQNSHYQSGLTKLKYLHQQYNLPNQDQLHALVGSLKNKVSIITGGPGTGKTTIIMLLLWLSYNIYTNDLKIKICAPTGRAAARVKESLINSLNNFKKNNWPLDYESIDNLLTPNDNFTTIHKLLGSMRHNIYFKHNQTNLLDIDILIVDESSMISLPLFSKLVMAINTQQIKHIIFLGDKNQLSSVEEGYVFASLTNNTSVANSTSNTHLDLFSQLDQVNNSSKGLNLPTTHLTKSNRNNPVIATLASNILAGDTTKFIRMFETCKAQLQLQTCTLKQLKINLVNNNLQGSYGEYFSYITQASRVENFADDLTEIFKYLQKYMILCLTNTGVYGTDNINILIEQQAKHILQTTNNWYLGKPIIILENDYSLGLFNGDIGICHIDNQGQANVYFQANQGEIKSFIPEMLPRFTLAYALTIHKSQGSEFDQVSIILGSKQATLIDKILTKELLYTAVTRAKSKVNLYASADLIRLAINNPTIRNTGLNRVVD